VRGKKKKTVSEDIKKKVLSDKRAKRPERVTSSRSSQQQDQQANRKKERRTGLSLSLCEDDKANTNEKDNNCLTGLLLGHTHSATVTASGLGVLATDAESPHVTETAVHLHLLHALEVLTHLGLDGVGNELGGGAVDDILLTVEHPDGDLEVLGLLHHSDDLLDLLGGKLTSTTRDINTGLLAEHGGKTTADTLDTAECIDSLLTAVDVGVHHTKDVSERTLSNERHFSKNTHTYTETKKEGGKTQRCWTSGEKE
jgi:hypothetical protein